MRYLLLIALTLASADKVRLDVNPLVLQSGGTVRVTCRVPRHALNREVVWGFENYLADTRQLDGEESRITWEAFFTHMPCDAGNAFCEVKRADGTKARLTQHVEIAGCEPVN